VLTSVDPKRAAPALPVLKEMLHSTVEMNGSSPRILGPTGLGRLGRAGAHALVEALADADPKTQIAGAHGLMDSDVFPPEAVPALLKAARGPDAGARHQALMALLWRKPPVERMIQPLLEALTDPEPKMRAGASQALPALKRAFEQETGWSKLDLGVALALVDPKSAGPVVAFLTDELENGNDDWRYRTLLRIPELGKIAEALAPVVSKLASSSDQMVRDAAIKALAAIKR
jgi:HEAT repeat protein